MSQSTLIRELESSQLKKDVPDFRIGDTVKVHMRIVEGEKERIQVFTGTVIAIRGSGLSKTFAVYRIAYGSSMERVFLLHSPRIAKIEIVRRGKVRRAKLYYLRGKSGKKAKIQEKIVGMKKKRATVTPPLPKIEEGVEESAEAKKEDLPNLEESKIREGVGGVKKEKSTVAPASPKTEEEGKEESAEGEKENRTSLDGGGEGEESKE